MKISYINSVCVKNDAISNAVRHGIEWLCEEGHDVHLYTYMCEHENLPFTQVREIGDILFDEHFQQSDLDVFHYGFCSPLFDLISILPKQAKRLVVFHNITPKQFVREEDHEAIDKSMRQMHNIGFAHHVVCDSQINLNVLSNAGIKTPATVLPLPVQHTQQLPESKPSMADNLVRLAFIGRIAVSKGPDELMQALEMLLQSNQSIALQLDIVSNLLWSDQCLLNRIQSDLKNLSQNYKNRFNGIIHANASEESKELILRNADMLVLPSYHEGFCVPILEALGSGCRVVAYESDISNTKAISGGFATLVPVGNIQALSQAVNETAKEVISPLWRNSGMGSYRDYSQKAYEYVSSFSPENCKARFIKFIENLTS